MREISPGKLRGLQQCATPRGGLAVLALDHRNNLRRVLRPSAPETVPVTQMIDLKMDLISALATYSSAVLLDPELGAFQAVTRSVLPGKTGLIVALEATGYEGDSSARKSRILEGWSVEKIKQMGASAVKLLVYYHPQAHTSESIVELVESVARDCMQKDLLLILEPLSYSLDPGGKKLSAEEKRRVVIQTARDLVLPGVDLLKAEFPWDASPRDEESTWGEACAELSENCPVPWVVLSAGVTFETYLRQVCVACRAGSSGVAAGRAVWKEAVSLDPKTRLQFLRTDAAERMGRLQSLVDALGRPVSSFFSVPHPNEAWFRTYH